MRFFSLAALLLVASSTFAQEVTEHHEHLKFDVGDWVGAMTMQVPGSDEPMSMEVKETNTMVQGGLWLISTFESGPFVGRGQFGYDPAKKKYVGTWIDNMSPHLNVMQGNLNKDKGEMVMTFTGVNQETGKPQEMKSVTTRPSDNERKFVMYAKTGDKWEKSFEINYRRKK